MAICVALFSGTGIGGKHSLSMQGRVAMPGGTGARNVKTCLRSGNAVFDSGHKDASRFADRFSAAIAMRHGLEARVLLPDTGEREKAIAGNPCPEATAGPGTLHPGFPGAARETPDPERPESPGKSSERFHPGGRVFYVHAPEGVGGTRLAASAGKLPGIAMTDRNRRTVCDIRDMAKACGDDARQTLPAGRAARAGVGK